MYKSNLRKEVIGEDDEEAIISENNVAFVLPDTSDVWLRQEKDEF